MINDFSLGIAFVAGLVSFLAPCVLPIIPGFLAYLAGDITGGTTGQEDVAEARHRRLQIFMNSLFFVLGFSVVFALFGVLLNTLLESVAYDVQAWGSRVGGVIIIVFGLYLLGLVRIKFLERDHKFAVKKRFKSRYATSFLFGLAFAAGWSPCVGPALGAILGLATSAPGSAFFLLLSYALGLGVPFLIVGLFTAQASRLIESATIKHAGVLLWVNRVFGLILIGLGVLIFTQKLSLIANFGFLNNLLLQ